MDSGALFWGKNPWPEPRTEQVGVITIFSKHTKRVAVIASAAALMSIGAPAAMAQSASQQGYDGEAPLGQVQGIAPQQEIAAGEAVAGQVVNQSAGDNGGALPFTGWDLGIVLALGLALAGTGLAVRRAARSTAD